MKLRLTPDDYSELDTEAKADYVAIFEHGADPETAEPVEFRIADLKDWESPETRQSLKTTLDKLRGENKDLKTKLEGNDQQTADTEALQADLAAAKRNEKIANAIAKFGGKPEFLGPLLRERLQADGTIVIDGEVLADGDDPVTLEQHVASLREGGSLDSAFYGQVRRGSLGGTGSTSAGTPGTAQPRTRFTQDNVRSDPAAMAEFMAPLIAEGKTSTQIHDAINRLPRR